MCSSLEAWGWFLLVYTTLWWSKGDFGWYIQHFGDLTLPNSCFNHYLLQTVHLNKTPTQHQFPHGNLHLRLEPLIIYIWLEWSRTSPWRPNCHFLLVKHTFHLRQVQSNGVPTLRSMSNSDQKWRFKVSISFDYRYHLGCPPCGPRQIAIKNDVSKYQYHLIIVIIWG